MTTLKEIGFTLAGGSTVMVIAWALFGWAVIVQSPLIAPRAIARPKSVIYGNVPGNAWMGWIPWTLGLSYDTLLEGIPGTGTRDKGQSGSLLKVNLDGIVLLRFHAVCLRVSLLAAVIFVTLLVPSYLSAQCFDSSECGEAYNLTDYQRTTLANIPANTAVADNTGTTTAADVVLETIPYNHILWRLYAVVISFWIVASYLCLELQQEWAQILAMRRVYYLEYDIWGQRRNELKETLLQEDTAQKEPHLYNRDPWVPHPEQRDTVPNIALYSILVGGLPSLPEQAADSFNAEATIQFSKRESIDWQLSLTTTFFDHCVPNQPGFSSSVAAVTIIPSAMELSVAWRKWYSAASKLRRLRFIRHQIAKKLHYDIDDVNDHDEDEDYGYGTEGKDDKGNDDKMDYGYDNEDALSYGYEMHEPVKSNTTSASRTIGFATDDKLPKNAKPHRKDTTDSELPWNRPEDDDISDNFNIYASSDFGPEQAAVYAREFAQSAAPCCPVGCNEGRLRRAGIDELKKLERTTAVEVHQANLELRAARRRATRADTHNYSDFVAPKSQTINALSCVQLGEESGETAVVSEPLAQQVILNRYDRKASLGNTEQAVKVDREKRLNQLNKLSEIVSGNLGLEAQLFQKNAETASARPQVRGVDSKRRSFNGKTPGDSVSIAARSTKAEFLGRSQSEFQVDGLFNPPEETKPPSIRSLTPPKNKSHRRTPSTDGVRLPRDIALEAQLVQGSSNHSSSNRGARSNPRLSFIREATIDSTASSATVTRKRLVAKESAPLQPLNTDFDDTTSAHWAQVESIVTEAKEMNYRTTPGPVPNGAWSFSGLRGIFHHTKKKGQGITKWAQQQSKEAVVNLARESTYAVLTFTSRQAAVAARSCLADGRGAGRWMTLKEIPIPPLSDAAPGDIVTFRNCCRPVTLSINERQKSIRHYWFVALC
jgi:hypothetical protein